MRVLARVLARLGELCPSCPLAAFLLPILLILALPSCAATSNRRTSYAASATPLATADEAAIAVTSDSTVCGEILLGVRNLRADELDRVDTQLVTGCRFSAADRDTGIGFEIGFQASDEDEDEDDLDEGEASGTDINELYLGLFTLIGGADEGLHPYVGVGFSFLETRTAIFSAAGDEDEDVTVLGAYADVGIALISESGFRLSFDWRTLRGTETGTDLDADYDQFALVAGISF